jgi:hypothetical protein
MRSTRHFLEGGQLVLSEPSDRVAKTSGFVKYHSEALLAAIGWQIAVLGGPKGGSHLRRVRFFFGAILVLSTVRGDPWTFGDFDFSLLPFLPFVTSSSWGEGGEVASASCWARPKYSRRA